MSTTNETPMITPRKNQMNKTPITRNEIQEMVNAMRRLYELGDSKIITQDSREKKTLEEFLSQVFLEHASEFLSCWLAVTDEYEPLVNSFASLQLRSANFIKAREARLNPESKPKTAYMPGRSTMKEGKE